MTAMNKAKLLKYGRSYLLDSKEKKMKKLIKDADYKTIFMIKEKLISNLSFLYPSICMYYIK